MRRIIAIAALLLFVGVAALSAPTSSDAFGRYYGSFVSSAGPGYGYGYYSPYYYGNWTGCSGCGSSRGFLGGFRLPGFFGRSTGAGIGGSYYYGGYYR